MKLYATTTSERATKGQGGNKYLMIEIFISNRDTPDYIITTKEEKGTFSTRFSERTLFSGDYNVKYKSEIYTENKSQKVKSR